MILLDSYKYESDFDNKFVLSNVEASAGNVIVIGVSGLRNAICLNFETPVWDEEIFTVVSEVLSEPPLSVFILKCVGSGTHSITAIADEYGSVAATAMVFNGSFGESFFGAASSASWTTGDFQLPSVAVSGISASDFVCVFLEASEQDLFGNAFPDTIFSSNGDERIVAATTAKVGRLYACTKTGTGSVTASFTKSNAGEPAWRIAAFRLYESGGGTSPVIDSYPAQIRSGQTGIAYTTSNISSVTSIAVGSLAATSISDTTGDGTHALPGLVDETVHELFGTKTVSFNAGAATVSREFLPPTGNDFVTLSGTINTGTGAVGADFSPAVVVDDQIVKPVELDIDEQGNILGDDGVYLLWHIQASTKIARSYTLTLGDLEEDAPPVMPADTSVNIPENSTAVGTYAAVSGTGPITYSLSGSDAALFSINSSTGVVAFLSAPNFESGNNTRNITVTATNAHGSDSQNITVNVTNIVESPVMPADRNYRVSEGNTNVGNGGAEFADGTINYSKSGDDHALFNINSTTGGLSFISPAEIGEYSVTVTATNSSGSDSQLLTISVTAKTVSNDKFFKANFF